MLTPTKVFNLTIVALLALTLALGAPSGYAQGKPSTAVPPEPLSDVEAAELYPSDFSVPSTIQNPLIQPIRRSPAHPQSPASNAENVEFVGHIGGYTRAVAVQGDYAYIGEGPGLTILDISNPTLLTIVGKTPPLSSVGVLDVYAAGDYAYIANGNGLRLVDVSDPTSPTEAGSCSMTAVAVTVVGDYAYVAGGDSGLRVVDISDPANPTEVGFYDTPEYAHSVAVAGDYAYIVNSGLWVINVSDPTDPVEVGFYNLPRHAWGVAVTGNYVYVADAEAGLWLVDVSDPVNPVEVGFYNTPGSAQGVAVVGGYAYVADWESGLRVVNVSNPTNPTEVSFYDTPGYAIDVAVVGGYAFGVGDGLWVVDISDPTDLTEVGFYDMQMGGRGVAVAEGYAYVAAGYEGGLRVVDVSDLTDPTEAGFYDTPGFASDVAVDGGYAYVADYEAGLRVVDISDPANPTEVGFYDTPGSASGVIVVEGYAYVGHEDVGLRVVDISDPANPTEVGFYDTPGHTIAMAVVEGYAYVSAGLGGGGGLRVVDVSDPANPTEVGFYDTPGGSVMGIDVVGGYAYVADYDAGLRVVDISDPANSTEVGFYDTQGYALGVVADRRGYIYVADADGGLIILRSTLCELNKQPVLLVHGWGDKDSLSDDTAGFAQLYKWMQADGYVEGCNLFYATGVKASNSRQENKRAIQDNLWSASLTFGMLNSDWNGHFDIIGHSYGGLNARFYLESSYYDADYANGIRIDNLFTLGTPHGGVILSQESYPMAMVIAGSHVLAPKNLNDFLSAADLHFPAMNTYNISYSPPNNVCYRLIGGNFLLQSNVPLWLQVLYSLSVPWTLPNDIGVSLRSSLQLKSPLFWLRGYRNIVTVSNTDMHSYDDRLGLSAVHSYVSPADTYNNTIAPNLGADMSECNSSQINTLSATDTQPTELTTPPLLIASDTITGGQTITGTVLVDWSGQTAFYVTWMSGDLDLTLRDPSGVTFTPGVAISDTNADYGELILGDSGLATYIFTNTLSGDWTYTVTAAGSPYPIPFDLYVIPDSPLVLRASAPEWQPFGTPVVITASLFYSTTPVSGASVQAQVTRLDGGEGGISLRDDGLAPDDTAGDGIYSGTYTDTTAGGFYYVLAEASGTYTQAYHRTAQAVFAVAADSATLDSVYADRPNDDNGDGLYEYLDLDVGVNVTQLGDFTLAAVLQDAGGQYIDLANATVYSATEAMTLTLRFDGEAIRDSELDGPYTVTEMLLLDDDALIKLDEADNVWVTPPYDHLQFGAQRYFIYLPLLLRNYEPIQANFTAWPTTGVAPLTVFFTNISTGPYTTSLWNFGNQTPGTLASPTYSHTYTAPGSYTVTLTVSGTHGADTMIRSNYITVLPVLADFDAAPTTGVAPLTVVFSNTSGGVYAASLWAFGDGSTLLTTGGVTSTLNSPTHTYTTPGSYTVTLTVSGTEGSDDEIRPNYITVNAPVGSLRYVAPGGVDSGNDCANDAAPCATVQQAVDVSVPGDEIRVATGVYTGVHARPRNDITSTGVVTQVVYVSQTVTIRGGYNADFSAWNPAAYTSTLDAQGQGRVLYIVGDISTTIEGLHITGGDAAGMEGFIDPLWEITYDAGGGVYVVTATVTISNNQVFSNTGSMSGGLHLHKSANSVLNENTFTHNYGGGAGGLYLFHSDNAILNGNTITLNNGSGVGGLMLNENDNATLTGNIVSGNQADSVAGLALYNSHNATIGENIISDNVAWNNGGMMLSHCDNAAVVGNTLTGNDAGADGRGGGLHVYYSTATLTGNIVFSNTAGYGGGLRLDQSDVALTNNILTDNRAYFAGSGLHIFGSSSKLLHTTIARNNGGDGSGISIPHEWYGDRAYSSVALTNTILVSHTVGISVTGGNTITVNGILWHNTPITVFQAVTATVTIQNQHEGDPAFASDGYHLLDTSAAIDQGVDAGVMTDIDDQARPQGAAPDLGADEYYASFVSVNKRRWACSLDQTSQHRLFRPVSPKQTLCFAELTPP
ncbi:MAG: PKD domain-containing protein [Chloroflexi bacterium]|nr:PKD domain-containing protein [Chloroflexota bacterium]